MLDQAAKSRMDLKAIVEAAAVLAVSTDIADAELASRLMKKKIWNQYLTATI